MSATPEDHEITAAVGTPDALRESEGRFRALVSATNNVVFRMGPDWREMRRLDGGGFVVDTQSPSTDWVETYIPADEWPQLREVVKQAVRAKAPFELEHRVLRVDGTVGWMQSRAVPLLDGTGEIVEWLGAASDVTARVKADQSFRRLFQASPAPFLVLAPDPPRFTIRDVNDAYLAATLTTRESIVGRGIFEAFPDNPDDATADGVSNLRASLERALDTREPDAMPDQKYDIARPDGGFEERWWSPVNSPVLDERGEVEAIIHNVADVTEERRAEATLRGSEERLHLAVDNAEVGFWDVDLVNDTLIWPPLTKAMFGISADVPVTMQDFYDGLHPDDHGATSEAFAAAADPARRALYDAEYRTVGKEDGVVRWVAAKGRGVFDGSGRCLRVAGTAIEITPRKATEAALRESEAAARVDAQRVQLALAAGAIIGTWFWDIRADHFTADEPFARSFGLDAAQCKVGIPLAEMYAPVHPDDKAGLAEAIEAATLKGGPYARQYRVRRADGQYYWIEANGRVDHGPDGTPLSFPGVLIDVEGRRAVEEERDRATAALRALTETLEQRVAERTAELEAAHEQLRQSQKMEAMGSLTGGVAHDFNNLLTPIVGSLDMLQRKGLGGEREQRLIAGAIQSADRAKMLVQRLLAFARRQPLQAMAVDLTPLVRGMADLVSSTTGPQIKVVVDAADNLPPAKADPNQLEMAILNLAVNARDAMPKGGTLRISVDAETVGRQHRANVTPGRYLRLSVADTGEGMDEETLKRAVEPFFSTKGVGKGTGLGLSMVHGLASQLGGTLTIHSKRGVGTNIELWLPQSAELLVSAELTSDMPTVAQASGTALLVDDEDLVRLVTADMLIELGYAVVEAASAEEALRLVERGLQPDLLVTDHLMPGMSGTELARALRGRRPSTKVLIVSGYAEAEGVAPDLPRLTKPFRNSDLAASLAELD